MKTLTFETKSAISTVVLGVALVITAGYGLYAVGNLNGRFSEAVDKTARKIALAGVINTAQSDMAAGERGMLMFSYAKDAVHIAPADQLFEDASKRLQTAVTEIRPLLVSDRAHQALADIEARMAQWLPAYSEVKRLAQAGDLDASVKLLSEKITPHYLAMGKDAEALTTVQNEILQQERLAAEDQFSTSKWFLTGLLIVGLLAAGASLALTRALSGRLQQCAGEMYEGSRQVASASGQVASASQSLAQGTSEQAATLEETSSSTTEIAAITKKNAENTRTVAGLMAGTEQLVTAANRNLEEMVQSMKEINGSSAKISKIIRVIDEIAFQTNILALNAAVEAARAGEAGMGFAVVADEVRNLAQRSAQAAKDTADLIEESIARSNEGSVRLDSVAQSIRQITTSANEVKTLVDEVNTGSQEQTKGIEQITTAVGQMEEVTQRSAANAEQSAAASEELAAQAQGLYDVVDRLKALVGGESGAARQAPDRTLRAVSSNGNRAAHSAGIAALANSLHSEQPAPAHANVATKHEVAFPLDGDESQF